MKRHWNKWLNFRNDDLPSIVEAELQRGLNKFGPYHSMHEAYAVIKEELEEFWDSVKEDDPDPTELLHVAATACRALEELCMQARTEVPTGYDGPRHDEQYK